MKQRLLFGAMLLPLSLAALAIDAPYELNKSDYTGTDITLTWDAVPGATGYLVSVYSLGESMTGQKAQNHTLNKENPTYNSRRSRIPDRSKFHILRNRDKRCSQRKHPFPYFQGT